MPKQNYNILVYILRGQPFHLGHKKVIDLALQQCDHLLILIGSSFRCRTIKNPFTFEERQQMILGSLDPQYTSRITIRPLRDNLYCENKWLEFVQQFVDIEIQKIGNKSHIPKKDIKIGIIGHEKDQSSYYVHSFPTWDFVEVGKNYIDKIDATTIRESWLSKESPLYFESVVPQNVYEFITNKFSSQEFERLCREYEHLKKYRKQWENAPYEVIFNTVDAVIVQAGHILLIRRKHAPGENTLALPGGFLGAGETIEDSLIREIYEETNIKVPEPVLRNSIKAVKTFDAVGRSLRGRTVTHAHLIELNSTFKLAKTNAGDDAGSVSWMSLSDMNKMEDQFFEDHFYIVSYFLGNR